jgi:hypothetical protein
MSLEENYLGGPGGLRPLGGSPEGEALLRGLGQSPKRCQVTNCLRVCCLTNCLQLVSGDKILMKANGEGF